MANNLDDKLTHIREKIDEVSETAYKIDKEVALQKAAFDAHMAQDEKMYEEFKRMNDILQENTLSLKEHMAQTMLLREMVLKMDSRMMPLEVKHIEENAIKHFRKDKLMIILKIAGAIAALASAGVAAKPFLVKWLL
jgi:hypothetical protein